MSDIERIDRHHRETGNVSRPDMVALLRLARLGDIVDEYIEAVDQMRASQTMNGMADAVAMTRVRRSLAKLRARRETDHADD